MTVGVADLGSLTEAGASTWAAMAELAATVTTDRWAVVGGQMVAIHAARAGVEPPRVTEDGDVVVDVRGFGRGAMREVAGALVAIGFDTKASPEGVTRFERGRARIDLLAPEGMGPIVKTVPPGYAVQAPGATQALERTELVTALSPAGSVTVRCPSLFGAVIAKAAGSTEIVSLVPSERLKHQTDLVFLLSLLAGSPAGTIDAVVADCSKRDRRRLRTAIDPILADRTHRARSSATNFGDVEAVVAAILG